MINRKEKNNQIFRIAIFCFLIFVDLLSGQEIKPTTEKIYDSFIGEVNILSVFIDTDTDSWDEETLELYYNELLLGQKWLQNESEKYEVELDFINDFFIENKEIVSISSEDGRYSPYEILLLVMKELGYENFDDFISYNNFDFDEEKLKLVLFVKSKNRSHAFNWWSTKYVDIAIIYCKSSGGNFTDSYVIAHELLHHFGAWDLYYGESQTKRTAALTDSLFPHSIMHKTHDDKDNLIVDSLTAWRIGWTLKYEEIYKEFDRNQRDKGERSWEKPKSAYKYKYKWGK